MWHRIWSELRFRLRALGRRQQVEHDLALELESHLSLEAEKLEARGLSPADAQRAARIALGGLERIKEDVRATRGVTTAERVWADLRYVVRTLRARPAFTTGVLGTFALGIGANTAMFGITDRLLFRNPNGLRTPELVHRVRLSWTEDGERRSDRNMQFPRFTDFARDARSVDVVGAFQVRTVALGAGDDVHEAPIAVTSASYLNLFDAPPIIGRWYGAAEDAPPAGLPVVVLSYNYWLTRYGGRPDVLGNTVQVDRMAATVIGVAPEGFTGLSDGTAPVAFVPMSAFAHSIRGTSYVSSYSWGWLELAVHRKPGVTPEAATADLTNVFIQSWRAEAAAGQRVTDLAVARPEVTLDPVQAARGAGAQLDSRVALWLSGVALLVLLIACANIGNLFLSRAVSRQREIAMRLALGVSRGRLTSQLLLEGLVLGATGGAAGVLVARYAGGALRAALVPDLGDASIVTDLRTLAYTLILALVAGALTTAIPAALASRTDVASVLKTGGRGATHRRSRVQSALVVVQGALSMVLLIGAALFVRSLQHAHAQRLGYDVANVLYAEVNLRGTQMSDTATLLLAQRMEETARTTPGISHATTAASVPFWSFEARRLTVPGVDSVSKLGRFGLQVGSHEYFKTMGTRILRGRAFLESDREDATPIAVVSEAMARVLWPGQDAIGRCFRVGDRDSPCREVVGIAEDATMESLDAAREFTYFLPEAQFSQGVSLQFFFRSADGGTAPVAALRSRLQALLPGTAYVNVVPMERLIAPQLRGWQVGATMFVAFGGLALVLAAFGLHSLVAYDLAQRRKELGVRLALGASRSELMRFVVGQGTQLAVLGVGIGLAIALAAANSIESLLFQQPARDPAVVALIGGILLVVSAVATLVPGWRATGVDPTVALRTD